MKKIVVILLILNSINAIPQITQKSGSVGIGKNIPAYKLDVNGSINGVSYFLSGVALDSANTVKSGFFTKYQYNRLVNAYSIYTDTANSTRKGNFTKYQFNKLNSLVSSKWGDYLTNRIYYNGYVGIGTTTPGYPLDVFGKSQFRMPDNTSKGLSIEGEDVYMIFNTGSAGKNIIVDDAGIGIKFGINTTPSETFEVNGVIKSSSYIMHQGIFAEIYCEDASTAQSIPNGTTYTKLTHWTTNGDSQNCTADAANDKITITKAGYYEINANSSSSAGTTGVEFMFAVFAGGVEVGKIHSWSKFANASDKRQGSIHGYYHATSVPIDIDVRARHGEAGAVNLTVVYSNMTVKYIGE